MKRFVCMLLALLLAAPAMAETVQDQALAFIQRAGIGADSVLRVDNCITVTLINGGTATLYTYGDFDPYDLNWRFAGAADTDVALYLDHALTLLADLEDRIPAAEEIRARNYAVMVSNSLLYLENTGEQGLRVLLAQLSLHDAGRLNSLRARLASRLLGHLDATPVDPSEGLAWYDALRISVQDDLPPVDASLYEPDPLLAAADMLLMAREEAEREGITWPQVDGAKSRNVVAIRAARVTETEEHATIWGVMYSAQYALYDGTRLRQISGAIPHLRIEMKKAEGAWTLDEVIFAEDGDCNWPSILAFCDNDEALARAVTALEYPDMDAAVRLYLQANGFAVQ